MKRRLDGVLAAHGTLAVAFLGVLLGGCASAAPHPNYYDASPELEEALRCNDSCWLMSARNDNFYEARVYINGQRVANLPGMMGKKVGIPISRSMLDGSGCIVVSVRLFPDTKAAESSRECPVAGSRLELDIGDSYAGRPLHLWLQDWRTKR